MGLRVDRLVRRACARSTERRTSCGTRSRGLGFAIAFYYGITALASPILFRKVLTKSWKHFLLAGVVPVLSGDACL